MIYVTGLVVFIQLITGGLRVFNFIDETTHITFGFITFIVAIATLIVVALTKPRFRPAIGNSAGLVVLIFIQGLLGFNYLDTSNTSIIMIHYVNALLIFGAAIGGVFNAMRWERMTQATVPATQ